MVEIAPEHCRAARAFLGWSQQQLADRAGVALKTVANFEKGRHLPNLELLASIRAEFESVGVEFIVGENGSGLLLRSTEHEAATPDDLIEKDADTMPRERISGALDYVLHRDTEAKAAFDRMRKQGVTLVRARREIARALIGCLWEDAQNLPDRWPDVLKALAAGASSTEIFPRGPFSKSRSKRLAYR